MMVYSMNDYITGEDLKRLRTKLGVTQKEFAKLICASKPTVERWERDSEKPITGPIVALVRILENRPSLAEDYLYIPERVYPIRLWYMYKNRVCTLIDVDDASGRIIVKNYVDDIMYRAFGSNNQPNYSDYLTFLEERCFPKGRDKSKIILEELGLPFYDPFEIIKKTNGRMAEDDFWIEIEE